MIRQIYSRSSYGIARYAAELEAALSAARCNFDTIELLHFGNSSRLCMMRLLLPGRKFVIVHDVLPRSKVMMPVTHFLFWLARFRASCLIFHSNYSLRLAKLHYGELPASVVIPHGTKVCRPKRKSLSNSKLRVLCLGMVTAARGQANILASIIETNPSINFYVVGKCTDVKFIQFMQKTSNVNYLGYSSDAVIKKLMYNSDVFLSLRSNSVGETSGASMMAIGYGLPILYSDVGSNREILGRAGLPVSSKSFTRNIRFILRSYSKYSGAALILAKQYSWDAYVAKMRIVVCAD